MKKARAYVSVKKMFEEQRQGCRGTLYTCTESMSDTDTDCKALILAGVRLEAEGERG